MRRSTRRSSVLGVTETRRSTRRSSVVGHSSVTTVGNFSTRFSLPSFLKRVNKLTNSQRNAITLLGFGNVLQIPDLNLAKNLLVELMDRWCCERRAFRLVPGNITVTLMDVALILGLRVTGEPVILEEGSPLSELEREYGATLSNRKITIPSIEERLDSLGCIDDENFVRTFLLFIFGALLFPNTAEKVDSRYLSLLCDLDKVRGYAWGAAVLEDIFNWLCKRKETHVKYIGGCLILLQIWCHEHIDIARPSLLYCSLSVPRICRWGNIKNIRTLNREWFTTKFEELRNSQVIWELKPTCIETEVDIVKELLELQSGTGEPCLVQSSSTSGSLDHEDNVPSRSHVLEHIGVDLVTIVDVEDTPDMQLAREVAEAEEDDSMELTPQQNTSITTINNTNNVPTEEQFEKTESTPNASSITLIYNTNHVPTGQQFAKTNTCKIVFISDDEEDGLSKTEILEEEIARLKKENDELRKENEFLKDKVFSSPSLEQENVDLKKEVDSYNRLVARLEELVFDESLNLQKN